MRKLFILLLTAAVTALSSQALIINNTAGRLAEAVDEDVNITTLTVAGTMDARDFYFITNELNELTTLDLTQVNIVACEKSAALYGTVTNYSANEIPRTAFFGKKLVSISLPSNLTSIGFASFAGCYQLQSITLPASLTYIDDYAFSGSALTSIEVPETVQMMGKGVFSRCEALQSAVIKGNEVGDFAFLGDFTLSSVQLGPNVNNIGKGSFNGCTALTTVNIDPACRMNHIDEEAFINSGLENIDISTLGIGTIGDWAFAQTKISTINLTDGMSHLGEGAFAHSPLLTDVNFPSTPTGHGTDNPLGPSRARIAPSTLDRVNNFTFAGDSLLNAGNMLPEGVVSLGDYAFYNVSNDIDTMRLPSSIASLGSYAMAGMTGMKVLKTDAVDVPAVGIDVWAGVNQSEVPLVAPSGSISLYKQADQWMYFFFAEDDFLLGDVNNDGVVSIADVTTLIDYLLGGGINVNEKAADVNQDGTVSISDVTALIDNLLSGSAKLSVQRIRALAREMCMTTEDALTLQTVSMQPGETRTVDVALNNIEHDYTALQCELVLPEGLSLTSVNGIDRGSEHSYFSIQHEVEKNVYTMIGVSMALDNYAGHEGNVLQLTLTASDDFNAQDAELLLTNVMLVTPDHLTYLASDALSRVNDGSGIEQINADKQIAGVRYINVAGQESEQPFDGVNIVVTTYTDGTVTTVKVMR